MFWTIHNNHNSVQAHPPPPRPFRPSQMLEFSFIEVVEWCKCNTEIELGKCNFKDEIISVSMSIERLC